MMSKHSIPPHNWDEELCEVTFILPRKHAAKLSSAFYEDNSFLSQFDIRGVQLLAPKRSKLIVQDIHRNYLSNALQELRDLYAIYRNNLNEVEKQIAQYGIDVPLRLINEKKQHEVNIQEIEAKIAEFTGSQNKPLS